MVFGAVLAGARRPCPLVLIVDALPAARAALERCVCRAWATAGSAGVGGAGSAGGSGGGVGADGALKKHICLLSRKVT